MTTTDPYGIAPDFPTAESAGVPAVLAGLVHQDRVAHIHTVAARAGRTADWPTWLSATVVERLGRAGITRPWRHQVTAAEAARSGRHVVLTTGTASGKSLGYLLPILAATTPAGGPTGRPVPSPATAEATADGSGPRPTLRQLHRRPERPATALYLAPTKALAHDQLAAARGLGIPGWRVGALDGDSDDAAREFARTWAGYVLSNPDMLHYSVLPRHRHWADFLSGLEYVVIDEAHRYRGVFGAQVAQVIRRLRRLCAEYGAAPVFLLASATSTGPADMASRLVGDPGEEFCVVDQDASPHAAVTHVLANAGDDIIGVTATLLADLVNTPTSTLVNPPPDQPTSTPVEPVETPPVQRTSTPVEPVETPPGRQTVAFVPSRRLCEVIALRARDASPPGSAGRSSIEAYRGGYLPAERRALESRLVTGDLRGVAATNALELGIDIAGMDAVVIAGLPGSMASYWQQAGRAGRRDRDALVVGLGGVDQRDAYLLDHPELVFDAAIEQVVLDPENPRVLGAHLAAAAQERPLRLTDRRWFGPRLAELADLLTRQGVLRRRGSKADPAWYWTRPDRAVDLVDLRAQGGRSVQIVEDGTGRVVGHVNAAAADAAVHPEAVYLHQGQPYLVSELHSGDGMAIVTEGSPGWTTQPKSTRSVRVLKQLESRPFGAGTLARGDVEVTSQVVGYLRRDEVTGAVWDETPLDLPVRTLQTRAVWWTIDPDQVSGLGLSDERLAGAAHGAEHCAIGLLGLFVPSDRWDVGGLSTVLHADTDALTVFVHDGHPGGAGFADRGYGVAERWWAATLERLLACSCEEGCPTCVISPKCGNANQMLDKGAAQQLLGLLLG